MSASSASPFFLVLRDTWHFWHRAISCKPCRFFSVVGYIWEPSSSPCM